MKRKCNNYNNYKLLKIKNVDSFLVQVLGDLDVI